MTTLLQRARAYTDMYRIRRRRHTCQPLADQLREMLRLNTPGATLNAYDTLDRIGDVMRGHPDVVTVEVDSGILSGGNYGVAIAYNHSGNLLARVDVDPDGTLTLIPDEPRTATLSPEETARRAAQLHMTPAEYAHLAKHGAPGQTGESDTQRMDASEVGGWDDEHDAGAKP